MASSTGQHIALSIGSKGCVTTVNTGS